MPRMHVRSVSSEILPESIAVRLLHFLNDWRAPHIHVLMHGNYSDRVTVFIESFNQKIAAVRTN